MYSPKCLFSSVCEAAAFRRISIFTNTKTPPNFGRSAAHGSLWTTSALIDFMSHAGDLVSEVVFAQCELGSTMQRYTSLIFTSSLSESLWQLGDIRCSHEAEQHWSPPPNAAALSPPPWWPPRLCAVLALAIAELNLTSPSAISEARHIETAPSPYDGGDNTTVLPADHALLPSALLDIDDELEVDVEVEHASPYSTPPSFVNDSRDTSPFPWDEAPGADTDGEDDDPAHAPPHFFPISQRLPSHVGAPQLAPVPALAATIDPRGHRQAMKAPEAAEWQAAELAELQNHTANGSFREMNHGDARRLADAHGADFNVTGCLWVYKTKREG